MKEGAMLKWALCQRGLANFLLGQFLMACAFVPASGHTMPPPMELIKTKQHAFSQIKYALATSSENEMAHRAPIELPVSRFAEPECTYQVHLDSPNGPLAERKITIGEKLFHRWDCGYNRQPTSSRDFIAYKNTSDNSLYCMMVHSCTISSGNMKTKKWDRRRRRRQNADIALEIVDEFGCAIYSNITPEIDYVGDLSAVLEVQAFAMDYDQPAVFFKCNVRLLLKINGRCRRPNCTKK